MEKCYFNIETNYQEAEKLWDFSVDFIDSIGSKDLKSSSTYQTNGYFRGFLNSGLVYNVVVQCDIDFTSDQIFQVLEKWNSHQNFGVDFLLYGHHSVYGLDEWHIPHPALNTRACLLVPLLEINPHLVLPTGERVLDKLSLLSDEEVISIKLCDIQKTHLIEK